MDVKDILAKHGPAVEAALTRINESIEKVDAYNRMGDEEKATMFWNRLKGDVKSIREAFDDAMALAASQQA